MHRSCILNFLIAFLWALAGKPADAQSLLQRPEYSAESIANAAGTQAGRLAPNTIMSIYGTRLSQFSWQIGAQELLNRVLPTSTPRGEVYVQMQGRRLPLFFVSPGQINVLIPPDTVPGLKEITVHRDLTAGLPVVIRVESEAPEFFRIAEGFAAATHLDGRTVSAQAPAEAEEVIVIYGTGFGALLVAEEGVLVPTRPSEVRRGREYRFTVDGVELAANAVLYVGVTPGFAGLCQVNVKLPGELEENAQIGIGLGENRSARDLKLYTRKSATK